MDSPERRSSLSNVASAASATGPRGAFMVTLDSMFEYHAFGAHLRSEIEIPDLTPARFNHADWTLRAATRALQEVPKSLRGECETLPGLVLRLFDVSLGMRFEGDCVGAWDILDEGRRINCWVETQQQKEFFRSVLLGPIVSLLLEQSGVLSLHGSAVQLNGFGVAFLAPKLHGKSTLALALTLAGGRLITDDLVAVDEGSQSLVRPGACGLRLFSDSVERLCVGHLPGMQRGEIKHTLAALPTHMLQGEPVPLAAIYLLDPVDGQARTPAAERILLSGAEAVIAVAHRMKLPDDLIGYAAAGARLAQIAKLVKDVPVYRLRAVRGWERIAEMVDQILAWHSARAKERRASARPDRGSALTGAVSEQ